MNVETSPNIENEENNSDINVGAQNAPPLTGKMMFGETIEIDLDQRLKMYSNQYVGAYLAKSLGADGREYITYVCEPQYTPRNRQGPAYAAIANPCLGHLIGTGIGRSVGEPINRFVFIYENNFGRPIAESDTGVTLGMKSEKAMEKFVTPMVSVLKDMRDNDIVHGAIRPTNIFDGGKENMDNVILGDGLSLPPSMAQPVLLCPIDHAMAQPTGRGVGTNQDDLYSLGATIAMIIRSRDPMKGRSDAEIIQSKMQYGTYATLLSSDDHFSGAIVELLRGLLMDDRKQRWTLDDVLTWMDGRRLSPKQSSKKLKAARPLGFNNKTYSYPATFARDIFARPSEFIQMYEAGDVEQWIKRSLDDEAMLIRMDAAEKSAEEQGRGNAYWDRLVARMGIALDPDGPIRFKHLSFTGEGLSTALAEAFVTGNNADLSLYAEIFGGSLLSYWMNVLTELNVDMSAYVARFETCRNIMRQGGVGFGLERVLYFLNPDVHCLSPIVVNHYARTPEEFLMACEGIAALSPEVRPHRILDRHSIAFLCAKDRKATEPYLYELSSAEEYRYTLGTLQCFAAIQRYYKMPPLKKLSNWMADYVVSVFERFHDAKTREELRKKVNELRDKGDLNKLLAVLDDAQLLQTDLNNFVRAMREYKSLTEEKKYLQLRLEDGKTYGRREGREMAAVISGLIATLLIVGIIILYFSGARIV